MTRPRSATELEDRLSIAERAIADMTARIGELTAAVAEVAEQTGPTDALSLQPVTLGADEISQFTIGFYQREYDAADRPYRWTGRGNLFELRFRVNRSFGWNFAMELQQNPYVDVTKIRGYVDYIEIPLDVTVPEAVVRGVIPQRPFGRQAVLTFLLPNVFVPTHFNPESTDTRTLGVVFYEFRAVPNHMNEDRGPIALGRGLPASSSETNASTLLRKARRSLAASVAGSKKLL